MSRRIRTHLAYDGTEFHGWQVQPGLVTIQGTLQDVISEIEGAPVHVMASGRTDAGVHALEQVAAFTLANPIPLDNLRRAINRLLPPSVRILHVCEAPENFNPRYDAVAKTYEYRIWRGESCPPWEWRYLHHHPYPLNEQAMIEVATILEGEHDFSAFAASDERDELGLSKVRTIYSSVIARQGDRLLYRVRGSGFLKHMVRNIAGTLVEVGKGNLSADGLRHVIASGDRKLAGPTAPAKGLFLISVEY